MPLYLNIWTIHFNFLILDVKTRYVQSRLMFTITIHRQIIDGKIINFRLSNIRL